MACGRGLNPCSKGNLDDAALDYDSRDAKVLFYDDEAAPNARVPVAVMHDASRGVIIITCRGTMSLEDCLSDATCADIALSDFDPQLAGPTPAWPRSRLTRHDWSCLI